jgi:hypothetical protein
MRASTHVWDEVSHPYKTTDKIIYAYARKYYVSTTV